MAWRGYFTEICCIACNELEELGSGKREGWLSDTSLLHALHPSALAVAHTSLSILLILPLHSISSSSPPTTVRPSLSAEEGCISAIEWLPLEDHGAIAIGTSTGLLLIYSFFGDLIHKQIVHPLRIMRLRLRENRVDSLQNATSAAASSDELCVVLPGIVARFDGSDIQDLFRRWFEERRSRTWNDRLSSEGDDNISYERLPFRLWNVSKYGSCVDAAIVGIIPPPLLELQLLLLYWAVKSTLLLRNYCWKRCCNFGF